MKVIVNILLYIWQLPQHLVALCMIPFLGHRANVGRGKYGNEWSCRNMHGGISLGRYIFLSRYCAQNLNTIKHEQGHRRQSLMLGWLYLPVVGIPSIIWASLRKMSTRLRKRNYYSFYTERWADKLGGVKR